MKISSSRFYLAALFTSLLTPAPALAWLRDTDCTGYPTDIYHSTTFTYQISITDFPSPGALYAVLYDTGPLWTYVSGSSIAVYAGANTTISNLSSPDGIESVTLESILSDPSYNAEAVDHCNDAYPEYDECDIRFRSSITWYDGLPYRSEPSGSRSLQAYFLHEIGHCLGFDHENDFPDTMNYVNPFTGDIGGLLSVAENSREGVRSLYADSTTSTDIAISNIRIDNTLSDGTTRFIPFTDSLINENIFPLLGSSDITRAYCLHNLGTTAVSFFYKIYLSVDDNIIEKTDVLLATHYPTMAPNEPLCEPMTFSASGYSGSYYIGAIIDPDDLISESNENNKIVRDTLTFTF